MTDQARCPTCGRTKELYQEFIVTGLAHAPYSDLTCPDPWHDAPRTPQLSVCDATLHSKGDKCVNWRPVDDAPRSEAGELLETFEQWARRKCLDHRDEDLKRMWAASSRTRELESKVAALMRELKEAREQIERFEKG